MARAWVMIGLLSFPSHLYQIINGYLLKTPHNFGQKRHFQRQCLWEYLYLLNRQANRLSLDACFRFCSQVFRNTLTPLKPEYYPDSLKIYSQLLFKKTGRVKYLVYYDLVTDVYWRKQERIWEIYEETQIAKVQDETWIKLLGLLTSSLVYEYNQEGQGEITDIETNTWNYFSALLTDASGIRLEMPKVGDLIVCHYVLKYPEVLVALTPGCYSTYPLNGMEIVLTPGLISGLFQGQLVNPLISNLNHHIYNCYHYDDCFGEQILDSIDPELDEYQTALAVMEEEISCQ